jgi:hypothetical protein
VLHTVLIACHAGAGTIAFAAGCVAVTRRTAFGVYFAAPVAVVVFLAVAVGLDWPRLGVGPRVLFAVLTALGGYVLWRGERARRLLGAGTTRQRTRYLDHIGFTLVALFDGFAIIAVITAGGPGWLAAVLGVTGVVVGHLAIRYLKGRLGPEQRDAGRVGTTAA